MLSTSVAISSHQVRRELVSGLADSKHDGATLPFIRDRVCLQRLNGLLPYGEVCEAT